MPVSTATPTYYHNEKLISALKWFPPPAAKCSGDFYVEKVKLLVNWFKFSHNIGERKYYEYGVEMWKVKKFQSKRGMVDKKSDIPIPDRPVLFWQHIRRAQRELEAQGQTFNKEDYVFDNRDTVYSTKAHYDPVEVQMPDETNAKVTYFLRLILRREFQLCFSRENPLDDEEADRSYKFLKAVMTQKVRYTPEQNHQVAVEFAKNFVYDSNVIHRVPDSFYDPDRFDYEMQIAPRIEAWFGIYIGVREASNGDPMLNFGIVDKLFINAPSMSLLDYLLLLIDPDTRSDEVRENRKREIINNKLIINPSVKGRLNGYLSGIKLKSAEVWEQQKNKMAERHLNYMKLADLNSYQYEVQVPMGRFVRGGPPPPMRPVPLFRIYQDNRKTINFPNLPLVVVKSGANEYHVPMEFLQIHEKPQKYKNWIDGAMKDRFIAHATRKPHIYKQQTIEMMRALGFESSETDFVRSFGLSPDLKMVQCPGKVLNEPKLVNKNNEPIKMTPVIRGFKEKELNVVPERELCCALFVLRETRATKPCVSEKQATDFYKELMDGCKFRGMRIGTHSNENRRSLLCLESDGNEKFGFYGDCTVMDGPRSFRLAADHAKNELFDKLPDKDKKILLFIVISEPSLLDAYGYVKHYCDNVLGVASQYVTRQTVEKIEVNQPSHRIAFNLALKINAKLAGVNQELDWSERSEMTVEEKERRKGMPLKMFVGIDVTHPTANSGIDYSIASVVASINAGGTRYVEQVVTQQDMRPGERPVAHGKERTDILEGKFVKLLVQFAEHNNNRSPDHIVVYRDGVSDSEMLRVSHEELRSLRMEVNEFMERRGEKKEIKYTFIVVQKRHKTRLLRKMEDKCPEEEKKEAGDKRETAAERWRREMKESENTGIVNPSSGTICDKVIVSKYKFEFFLASHHGDLGTSRPGHYTVMYDDSGLDKDNAYKMTYELTFLSARCRKPISLPAPVHYAHLSCEKAKEKYRAYKEYSSMIPNPSREYIEKYLQPSAEYPGMSFA